MNQQLRTQKKLAGTLEYLDYQSRVLEGNPWKDPTNRQVGVYLPPGYHQDKKRYPVSFYLAGYTGSGLGKVGWQAFTENLPHRIDRLIKEQKMGDMIVVFPDCYTTLCGNQYVDSPGMGNYASYIME